MFMAWLNDDFNPGAAHMAIRWYRGCDISEGVDSWLVPGPRSIDIADDSLAEHGWRRLTEWHPVELGHAAMVDQAGGDDHDNHSSLRALRAWNGQQRDAELSLSAAR